MGLRIILRSGVIAARNRPPAPDPGVRSFVTSEGMGGMTPPGEEDGRKAARSGYGIGGMVPPGGVTGSGMVPASLFR